MNLNGIRILRRNTCALLQTFGIVRHVQWISERKPEISLVILFNDTLVAQVAYCCMQCSKRVSN